MSAFHASWLEPDPDEQDALASALEGHGMDYHLADGDLLLLLLREYACKREDKSRVLGEKIREGRGSAQHKGRGCNMGRDMLAIVLANCC